MPSIRHPGYGIHICLTLELPEPVAHIAGAHSGEGELLRRSLENTIIRWADHSFWMIVDAAANWPTRTSGCRPPSSPRPSAGRVRLEITAKSRAWVISPFAGNGEMIRPAAPHFAIAPPLDRRAGARLLFRTILKSAGRGCPTMTRLPFDPPTVLSALTVLGLGLAAAGTWLPHDAFAMLGAPGLALAYLAGGLPAAWRALSTLWHRRLVDIDLLMVVAAIAAAAVGAFLEGAVLLTLFSVSTTLEYHALGRARRAVEALMALRPEMAFRKQADGTVLEVAAAALAIGDTVILRPGARVPADGVIVTAGAASTRPASRAIHAVSGAGPPGVRGHGQPRRHPRGRRHAPGERQHDRAHDRARDAGPGGQGPSERFSSWFGQRYTLAVIVGAALAFVVFYGLGRDWSAALYKAATLLVAASPCAVVISVPAAILSALSAAARGGVLFKGGGALETLAAVNTFAFDKTGTLTSGRAAVTGIVALDGDAAALLALLAGLEAHSEHHIAAAIRREAVARGIVPATVGDVVSRPSAGIVGADAHGPLWAGNPRLAADMGATIAHGALRALADGSQTVVYLGRGAAVLGAVSVADEVRPSSAPALAALRADGVRRIVMMTGDRRPVALRIGAELGLRPDEIEAEMLPEDKVRAVAALAARPHRLRRRRRERRGRPGARRCRHAMAPPVRTWRCRRRTWPCCRRT